jgi:uncharacterized damage-inducible protein DinB
MKSFFQDLFDYNHHMNMKILAFISDAFDIIPEKSIQLFSHILNAHHIWNCRIQSETPQFGVWDPQTLITMSTTNMHNYEISLKIIQEMDINQTVVYKNTQGQEYENTIRDILFHVINHGTYHRGQIATDFRKNGLEPLATDYIFWKR